MRCKITDTVGPSSVKCLFDYLQLVQIKLHLTEEVQTMVVDLTFLTTAHERKNGKLFDYIK